MTPTIRKLTALLACTTLLGTASLAHAGPQTPHRTAAPHSQQRSRTPAPRRAPPAVRAAHRPSANYRRGGHVPRTWSMPSRTVTNWRAHRRLYQPPAGHQWVRGSNNDMLLVAVATGVITGIVSNAMAY